MPAGTNHGPRTYRIIGPQRQIDERETPHPRADRGEMGERLRSWRKIRENLDALRQTLSDGGNVDPGNSLANLMKQVPDGPVNPERTSVPDPGEMAAKIKEIARYFGADVAGISHLDQLYVYSHRSRGSAAEGAKPGDPIHLPHKYAICLGFAGDYDRYMTCNSQIADIEYARGQKTAAVPTFLLAAYIRQMGYPARAHSHGRWEVNPIPLAINAGLGELGRNGLLVHEEYGPRLHLTVVTTDLPMTVDEPVDVGMEDVCKLCMKCAETCPTYSIPFGDKVVVNGVEKWAVNVDTCYKGRQGARGNWTICLNCVTSCCYNKRSVWWHTLASWLLKKTPIPLRPCYIRPLLWMDDLVWGKRPWRRMKWLDYDNAPVPVTCHIPGCLAHHKSQEQKPLHKIPQPARPATP